MHTLVAGNRGFTIMQKLNSRISVDLMIFYYLAEFSSADEYNNFFKYDFFRRQFSRKHLWMYQGAAIVLRGGTEEFLQYDCAGAPWPCRDPDDNHCVGDGGFKVKADEGYDQPKNCAKEKVLIKAVTDGPNAPPIVHFQRDQVYVWQHQGVRRVEVHHAQAKKGEHAVAALTKPVLAEYAKLGLPIRGRKGCLHTRTNTLREGLLRV